MSMSVTGVEETSAAFTRYEELMRAHEHRLLVRVGEQTQLWARLIAESKGLSGVGKYSPSRDPHPGALVAKIRVRAGARKVTITEYSRSHSARYPSYPYPRRYEYHDRSFMRSAVEAERPFLAGEFKAMLRDVHTEAGFS